MTQCQKVSLKSNSHGPLRTLVSFLLDEKLVTQAATFQNELLYQPLDVFSLREICSYYHTITERSSAVHE